ncbi:efflux RND transporter permease subunit [Ferrimonas marina]|uniref:Hydrophobic/amphiphilic exporter-1, HAE1 family n=1 Tax=Ferrimonas marina TaxID=299255 RepID=A0A1M5YQZ0_9GAMM|nr:efflux RND transporter permease subunit [Ferrimonas marina]SHI14486.1 hydrophobic/amphiphilic exporter-1, HAE1 family [Ferrimonas marina]
MTESGLTAKALRRPVTVTMAFLALTLLGLVAARLLPLEMWPGLEIPQITVQVPYEGGSPAEVEREITNVLEESLATLSGVKRMRSGSSQTESWVRMDFNWDEAIGNKVVEVRERVDAVRHRLPADVERVLIWQFSTEDMPVLNIRLSSTRDLSAAWDLLDKQLKRPLERLPGVSRVALYGVQPQEIQIRLIPERLTALGLDHQQLAEQLMAQNFVNSAGQIRSANQVWQVSQKGEYRDIESIQRLTVRPGIRLGDVADIAYRQPEMVEGRHLDRTYAVGLDLFKESGANLVEVADRIHAVIDQVKDNPQFEGIELFIMDDQAAGVKMSLQDLATAGGVGALLSFAVLFLFIRNPLTTALIVVAVPLSVIITLGLMYLLGYTLNVLSMMGLLLAVGMLIDNSVVISESVLHQQAPNRRQAVILGVDKVALAVMAGTLTTAIVFLPNIFGVKVQLTVFLEHVAISICIALFCSLLISRTLLPLLLYRFGHFGQQARRFDAPRYRRLLSWVLNHPKATGAIALVVLASTALPMSQVKNADDDEGDPRRLYVNYQLEGRHSLATSEAMIDRMEAYLYANQEAFGIESVYSYYAPNELQTTLLLLEDLPMPKKALMEKISEGFPKYTHARPVFGWNGDDDRGMRLYLRGRSTEVLMALAEQLVPMLARMEGLSQVRSDVKGGEQELIVQFDRLKLARLGLDLQQSAEVVATALRGQNLRSFRHDPSGEIQIKLQWQPQWRQSLAQMRELPLGKVEGRVITLGQVATLTEQPRLEEIRHEGRQTALAIGANLEGRDYNDLKKEITELMDTLRLPEGYSYSFGGGFQYQDESQQLMVTNMLLAIAMIYIVMAALFESLLLPTAVISSILFSITGVFWTFLLTGASMTVMGMIGILVLMGIVVNNGIVLVDQINQREADLDRLKQAIIDAAISRLRPVLMTVATTILGLLPLAVWETRIAGGGPSYTPMAIAIIGGLAFSTLTSLFLVPYLYLMLCKLRHQVAIGVGRVVARVDRWLPMLR